MRKHSFVLLAVLGCSSGPRLPPDPHGEVVLEVRGAVKHGPYRLGRADLDSLPRHHVRGVDPVSGREADYEGPAIAALVSERVELEKGVDTVVVRTRDRRAVPIPLLFVRELRPVLASRADAEPLRTDLVAWPNLRERGLQTDPRALSWWARDVTALELADWAKMYGGALRVPQSASDAARRGAEQFGLRCFACHQLRKVGGEKGPDLTHVADRVRPQAFDATVQHHAGWAEIHVDAPPEEAISDLWQFLRAVARASPPSGADEESSPESERRGREEGEGDHL